MAPLQEKQFGEYTLKYSPPDMDVPRHRIIAEHPEGRGGYAGAMTWHPQSHAITNVHVDEAFRRQGLATEMWRMGQELRPRPKHSADRTDAGEAWSKAVGGSRPRRKQVEMNSRMRSEW